MSRVCTTCHTEKPLSAFHKSSRHPSGYAVRCAECSKFGRILGKGFDKNAKRDQSLTPPVTITNGSMRDTYVPEKGYYRNEGSSHIKSKGFQC